MRIAPLSILGITAAGFLVATAMTDAPTAVAAGNCPANATRASADLWVNDTLKKGVVVSGTHPCGRKITCQSGNGDYKRKCWWG